MLEDAGDFVGMINEEQGAEETEGEGGEQVVAENLVIGLDDGSVSVFTYMEEPEL